MPSSEITSRTQRAGPAMLAPLIANTARAVVSMLLALLIGEAGLRLAGVKFSGSFYTSDPVTGWFLRPNAEGWSVDERTIYVKINSAGMHDREHPVVKPPGTVRIAILGDSMTAALEVATADTSASVMEKSFDNCPPGSGAQPRKVEVLNFGVPGFNTAQMLLTLRNRVWKYSPDVVILEFFNASGMLNNRRELSNADASLAPFYTLQDGKLSLDASYSGRASQRPASIRRHNQLADWINRIRTLQLAEHAWLELGKRLARGKAGLDPRVVKYGPNYHWYLIYTPPAHPEIEDTWRVTEALIRSIRDEARSHGAQFWLAISNMPSQAERGKPGMEALLGRWGPKSQLYPDWRLESLAQREQFPLVALTDYLENYAERRKVYLTGWAEGQLGAGHWNELGQRVAGQYLAERFCGLLPR